MAIVEISEATVSRLIPNYGFKCYSERQTSNGAVKEYYTVWSNMPSLKEGDIVRVKGRLSVKLEEYTARDGQAKQTAAIHINDAKVESGETPF